MGSKGYFSKKRKLETELRVHDKAPRLYRPNVWILREKKGVPVMIQVSGKFYSLLPTHIPAPVNAVKRRKRST